MAITPILLKSQTPFNSIKNLIVKLLKSITRLRRSRKGRIMLLALFAFSTFCLNGQNVAMHFSRSDEQLRPPRGIIPGPEFTIEGWYKTASNSTFPTCVGSQGEVLWVMGNDTSSDQLMLGECNGELFFNIKSSISVGTGAYLAGAPGQIRGGWHHIAVTGTRSNPTSNQINIELYLDCNPVPILIVNKVELARNDEITFGFNHIDTSYETYRGEMDDLKIYVLPVDPIVLFDQKRCIPDKIPEGLVAYYAFDDGDPGNNNTALVSVTDFAGNANDAKHLNFSMMGSTSNYITATSPIFPRMSYHCPIISGIPFQTPNLTQTCGGTPVHLCIVDQKQNHLQQPPPHLDIVNWVYSTDNGNTWNVIDPLLENLTCGGTPPSSFSIDCTTSNLGYEDWDIRGELKFKDGADECIHYTKSTPFRVCCDLSDIVIQGSNNHPTGSSNHPPDLLCDGDLVDFSINLSPNYPFLSNQASGIEIKWNYNGTSLPQFTDLTFFSYTGITVDATTGACFQAEIEFHACDKRAQVDFCFPVDPLPICGTIDSMQQPTMLKEISSSPKVYEICPGQDAALKMDDPTQFMNCIPTWQYSFDQISWTDMGTTNSRQNTNILPSAFWPSNNIYYRIECRPIRDPSGCEPCYSNVLEIRLTQGLSPGSVTGADMFCSGDINTLQHLGHDPSLTNQWICNGIPVGTGAPTLPADNTGCYWVESSNACYTVETPKFCTMACKINAAISCPDVCPRPGVAVTMSACDSSDSCGKPLSYTWQVSGSSAPIINDCDITHVPDVGGTTYSVTVTNSIGCTGTASYNLIPCAQ